MLYQSVHQYPFYPGTGASHEIGRAGRRGVHRELPLPGGRGDADFGAAFHELFLPVARAFRPDLVIVSAGFDAHEGDPLARHALHRARLRGDVQRDEVARRGGRRRRLVLLLEGGYSLIGLPRSVHACLEVMGGRRDEFPRGASREATRVIEASREALKPFWKL